MQLYHKICQGILELCQGNVREMSGNFFVDFWYEPCNTVSKTQFYTFELRKFLNINILCIVNGNICTMYTCICSSENKIHSFIHITGCKLKKFSGDFVGNRAHLAPCYRGFPLNFFRLQGVPIAYMVYTCLTLSDSGII